MWRGDIERCSLGTGRAHVFRLPFFHDFLAEDTLIPETDDFIIIHFLPAKIPFFSPNFHPFPPKNTHNLTVGERVLWDDEARQLAP